MTSFAHGFMRGGAGLPADPRERASYHAEQAERLVRSWWLSSHVKGLLHATLAVYYSAKR
jgi:hypothetical protein